MNHLNELSIDNEQLQRTLSTLEESLVSFSEITSVPVTFYSAEGEMLWEHNKQIKICKTNASYCDSNSHCRHTLKSAMNIALGLGEVYIFVCDTGLTNLAYALSDDNKVIGYFIAGPIAMGTSREKSLKHFYDKVVAETIDFPLLMNMTGNIKLFSPKEITNLMTLYGCLFNVSGIGGLNALNNQKSQEQKYVVTKIIEMKKSNIEIDYPFNSEKELLHSVSIGDKELSKRSLLKYVEDLMVFENGDISIMKIRLLSIFAQLNKEIMYSSEYQNLVSLESLNNASTFKEMVAAASDFVESATSSISSDIYSGQSDVISKSLLYIYSNYMNKLSLTDIAEVIHINSSYLSALFKKEMGTTISSYIQNLRLEKATKKLSNTNLSVTEISLACGFESPSYFTKLYKEKYGKTPRQQRSNKI